jgi:hypothetical protein
MVRSESNLSACSSAPWNSKEARAIKAFKRKLALRQNKKMPKSVYGCAGKTASGAPCRRTAVSPSPDGKAYCSQHKHGKKSKKTGSFSGYVDDGFVVEDDSVI